MSKAVWKRHADAIERPIPAEIAEAVAPLRWAAIEMMDDAQLSAETQAYILDLAQEHGEAMALAETWGDLASDAKRTRNRRMIAFAQQTWAAAQATMIEAKSRLDFAVGDAIPEDEPQMRHDVYKIACRYGFSLGVKLHHHDDFGDPYVTVCEVLREEAFA